MFKYAGVRTSPHHNDYEFVEADNIVQAAKALAIVLSCEWMVQNNDYIVVNKPNTIVCKSEGESDFTAFLISDDPHHYANAAEIIAQAETDDREEEEEASQE